jgi:hypothetical protein
MSDPIQRDGIQLADKPLWELTYREHLIIFSKRIIALPSKAIGFKPFCLYLATWLLKEEHISEWVWLAVLVVVLFGIMGLKVAAGMISGRSPR